VSRSKPKFTEEELAQLPLAQREGFPEASGGFVLAVGGETITSGEVILSPIKTADGAIVPLVDHLRPIAQRNSLEEFKKEVRGMLEEIIVSKIANILLYRQVKKEIGEDAEERLEKLIEAEVRRFIDSFGGDYARAEEALKEMEMDWAGFEENQKKLILSQSYIASQLPENEPLAYSELLAGYNEMKDEFFVRPATIQLRLIDIQIEKLELTDPNQSRLEQARELANELFERIRGGEDFGELAKEYSHGHRAIFGGLWRPVQPENLEKPYDILAAEAEKIESGEAAGPIEAGKHIFIIKLERKRPKSFEPFEEVQKQVEAKIIFDQRKKTIDELEAKFVEQAAADERGEFTDFCLEEIYRMSNE